jgi:hypothetical protein
MDLGRLHGKNIFNIRGEKHGKTSPGLRNIR